MDVRRTTVRNVLTRTSGYLADVTSHSLQPYRGCSFGGSLCGVACYVRHNRYVTEGREWGSFLEARTNAADSYAASWDRERAWARKARGRFSVFLSSATDPFVPQEARLGITRAVLEAMRERPPDLLVVQTHSPAVADHSELLAEVAQRGEVRVHVSVETDRDRLPGLPPPAASAAQRLEAAARVRAHGLQTVVTVAPLLPIQDPEGFFGRVAEVADAVVLDHFVGGDGSASGWRTRRTELPAAMARVDPSSVEVEYRDRMALVAERHLPGRVGVGAEGFAGVYRLPRSSR